MGKPTARTPSVVGPTHTGRLARPLMTSATCIMSHAATIYSAAMRSTLRRRSSESSPMVNPY